MLYADCASNLGTGVLIDPGLQWHISLPGDWVCYWPVEVNLLKKYGLRINDGENPYQGITFRKFNGTFWILWIPNLAVVSILNASKGCFTAILNQPQIKQETALKIVVHQTHMKIFALQVHMDNIGWHSTGSYWQLNMYYLKPILLAWKSQVLQESQYLP